MHGVLSSPGMEDDQMSEDVHPCNTLSSVKDYEEVTVYNVSELSDKVESAGTDFVPNARDSQVRTADSALETHKQRTEKKANEENEERDNFRRPSAVDILRRNFGTSRTSSTLNNNNTADDQKDTDDAIVGIVIKRMEGLDAERSCGGEPEDRNKQIADQRRGLTSSDLDQVDVTDSEENCESIRAVDEPSQLKEHVYCTVYCIANDNYRKLPDNSESTEHQYNDAMTPSTSDVVAGDLSLDTRMHIDVETGHRPANIPEPYTLSNLIDSRTLSNFYNRDYNVSVLAACRICLEDKHIKPLRCCKKAVCEECLKKYISSQVRVGTADIVCPITECSGFLEESVVVSHLANEEVAKYRYFLELGRLDASTKPCPQCSLFTRLNTRSLHTAGRAEDKYKVQCSQCQLVWCFRCHSPWHQGLRCRDYRRGDKQLRKWASVVEHGQRNAQKCPRCKIHIQRTEGCDHMTCTQCNTSFCYRCGERYRHLRCFGDHTSNLSVFGCSFRYLPDRPHLRRLVRGSVCVSKLVLAPLVLVLVVVVGALSLVIGLVAFPIYYVCQRRRKRTLGTGRWF